MAKINVAKTFTFTHKDGKRQSFAAGAHKDVPDDVAAHWFVQAHLHPSDDESEGGKKADGKQSEGGKK